MQSFHWLLFSGDIEFPINKDFKAYISPSLVGFYTWGKKKTEAKQMPSKPKKRKSQQHHERRRTRAPLDLRDVDIDKILQEVIWEVYA